MEFTSWLSAWLKRHPLKEPAGYERTRYTDEVMARVTAAAHHEPASPRVVWPWQRVSFAFAVAAASLVIAIGVTQHRSVRHMRLAENSSDDAAWLEQTMQLLNELDEQVDDTSGGSSDDDMINDLELLDDSNLGTNS